MSSQKPFTAIIIGGSVAGLTLAHMFTRANINYVLLEGRETLSPQLGAGIVIMPNGCRILDQMGLLDPLREDMTRMSTQYRRRGDTGELVGAADWPRLIEEQLGYPCGIMERQKFLKLMFEELGEKGKAMVKLGKTVVEIMHGENEVRVKCEDGSEFVGDIVVGADGVHSRTRHEMHRIAKEEGPEGLMDGDLNKVTATYNCIFGISKPLPSLSPGDGHTASDINHSALCFVSQYSLPQWFFFSKLPKTYTSTSIPRFTQTQMVAVAEEFKDFKFTESVTLGDLMADTTSLSYLPLEEATHKFWTWGRVACVGDAIHKMTPNLGQGGNQAIESSATLTNTLRTLLATNPHPSGSQIAAALATYQDLRRDRTDMFVKLSALSTRDDALETVKQTLKFLYMPQLTGEQFSDIQIVLFRSAPYLEFLPQPRIVGEHPCWEGRGQDGNKFQPWKDRNVRARL